MKQPLNSAQWRERARRRLPRLVFDYLDGGAEDESCLKRNRAAIEALQLRPALLNNVSDIDLSVEILGQRFDLPIAITPTGLNGLFWPDGDVALARAAAACKIPFTLSTPSNARLERIALQAAGGTHWLQLYVMSDRSLAEQMLKRALAANFSALILTADVPVGGYRERDLRNGFKIPLQYTVPMMLDIARHPRWLMSMARTGMPQLVNLSESDSKQATLQAQAALLSRTMDRTLDWSSIDWIRRHWPRPLMLKGVLDPEDARRALDHGLDGVIVSNHGGRQLDSAPATMAVLPEIVAAVAGRVPVLVDSGFRRGSDVVKALALGARAVLLGRTTLYGLAAAGEEGVRQVLQTLRADIERTMILIGAASVRELTAERVLSGATRDDTGA
jgi:(S)-mandelate dehydrogenase